MSQPRNLLFILGSLAGGGAERIVIEVMSKIDRQRFAPTLAVGKKLGEMLDQVPADVEVIELAPRHKRLRGWRSFARNSGG